MKCTVVRAALSASLAAATIVWAAVPMAPAYAIPVFDSTNYAQNLLIAARTLSQINNQILSLQNEAKMLLNQGKNLSRIDFPQLDALRERLTDIDRLMGEARGIDFRIDRLDERYRELFPEEFGGVFRRDQRAARARDQLDSAMAAFRQTMELQNRIADNVKRDTEALGEIAAQSQGAEGALQVAQATNQLLTLAAKQQLQIQQMMAAEYRGQAIEKARAGQIAREARESTRRFLGDGKAYTPRD
ncbi:P-type conjugative transfer protein TrbJ [Sphingosinicella microcystinivorans]|uniref:Conjugal transfer protein TrbJ n=1 Tax=Sphingosinicella microcystinivorans TaxID=335406 RepID=A0AAD1D917_SPHMI|nr:P-type conjugative transfer protein TrbJ [Sphingosinicella microcystinivorans]RKS88302.1 P-type conjugative transfer protein TrbJ [Sphingosinicella microcystinivorans]BBE36113.1 conjugal transfer protein TrbJ [Sphingosinicella microcystinivorans]